MLHSSVNYNTMGYTANIMFIIGYISFDIIFMYASKNMYK